MKKLVPVFFVLTLAGCATQGSNQGPAHGVKAIQSPFNVKTTIDRFEAAAKARGLNVVARVDHAAGAQRIGKTLRPTELLIFGNPQGGTPLMECAQSVGIDLPLKVLAWQDANGTNWVAYNEPRYLMHRHRAGECQPAVENVTRALEALSAEALKP